MKILYIHQYFKTPDEPGGTRSFDLAHEFVKNGHEVIVISARIGNAPQNAGKAKKWEIEHRYGIEIHFYNSFYSQKLSFTDRIIKFIDFAFYSSFHILKIKADVVLATSTPISIAVPALVKKIFTGTNFIFEARDIWPDAVISMGFIKNKFIIGFLKLYEKFIYKMASHVVVLSSDMYNNVRGKNVPAEKISIIPNISEITRFTVFNENLVDEALLQRMKAKQPYLLYAGTFGRVNGLAYAVQMAAKLKQLNSDLNVVLVGDGNEKEDLLKLSKELGVENMKLFFEEKVSKNALAVLYKYCYMASSFVINVEELWANSANKFFDSLAASKPILINYGGWQADIIDVENIGLVVPPDEPEKAAELLNKAYLNKQNYLEQLINSARVAKEKYSLEVASENYFRILNSIV